MKKLILIGLVLLAGLQGCKKDSNEDPEFEGSPRNEAPDELLPPNGKMWTWGTISSINYYDDNSSEYRNAGGVSIFFKFNKNGTYKWLFYYNRGDNFTRDQVWTETEGTITIGSIVLSDGQTYKTFSLHPVKGRDRIATSTKNSNTEISKNELANRGSLSGTYAFSAYQVNGKKFLDILNINTNEKTSLHEEY